MAKTATLHDFLTDDEIARAHALWLQLKDTGTYAAAVERDIITPNLARINAALGQENNARYLAYATEFVFMAAARRDN